MALRLLVGRTFRRFRLPEVRPATQTDPPPAPQSWEFSHRCHLILSLVAHQNGKARSPVQPQMGVPASQHAQWREGEGSGTLLTQEAQTPIYLAEPPQKLTIPFLRMWFADHLRSALILRKQRQESIKFAPYRLFAQLSPDRFENITRKNSCLALQSRSPSEPIINL